MEPYLIDTLIFYGIVFLVELVILVILAGTCKFLPMRELLAAHVAAVSWVACGIWNYHLFQITEGGANTWLSVVTFIGFSAYGAYKLIKGIIAYRKTMYPTLKVD